MKPHLAAAILFVSICWAPVCGAAEGGKPDFSGYWELNVAKSKFGKMPKPARMTLESAREGSIMRSQQTTYTQQGPETIEGAWYLDDKDHTAGKDTTHTRWEGNTLVSERRSPGYLETVRMTLSSDGKTVTEEVHAKNPSGENRSTLVWDKRAKPPQ